MAYNSKNKLIKIIEIQNIVLQEKKRGYMNQKEIFYKLIEPTYHISIRTFNSYLGINAKKELADIVAEESKRNKAAKKLPRSRDDSQPFRA